MKPPALIVGRLYKTTTRAIWFDAACNHDGYWTYSEGIGDDAVETTPGMPILIIDFMRQSDEESNGIYVGLLNEQTVIVYADDVKTP